MFFSKKEMQPLTVHCEIINSDGIMPEQTIFTTEIDDKYTVINDYTTETNTVDIKSEETSEEIPKIEEVSKTAEIVKTDDDDDEYEYEYEYDNLEDEADLHYFEDIKDTDDEEDDEGIYVVSIDNRPHFYCKSIKCVREKIGKLAKNYTLNNDDCKTFINYKTNDEIQLIHSIDLILFSINFTSHTIAINKVYEHSDKL